MTMLVSDIMKTNVVSVPSTTSLIEAGRIMDAHNIRRMPVVNGEELIGIINIDDLDKLGSSQLPNYSFNELAYMRNKMTVEDVMHRDVITVSPETTVEAAVAIAQRRRVGSLLVKKDNKIVGIATTNDFFLGILNPLLGIGLRGSRIAVSGCSGGPDIEKVTSVLNNLKIEIINLFLSEPAYSGNHDLIVHLDTKDATPALEAIGKAGFSAVLRER
jgi:acetoin utilization protein AcuB